MSTNVFFTKENLDRCLVALAKEFRKRNGTAVPAEIVLIGGAAILENYGFRESTYDVDAIIHASSAMKEAINLISDKMGLPNGWLNTDFVKTRSYTPKLTEYSVYYKTFSNVLTVRTVSAEYLIAMKLMAGRKYKHDLSDVVGVLMEHEQTGKPIGMEQIDIAMRNLYGGWDNVPEDSRTFVRNIMQTRNYAALYQQYREEEQAGRTTLLEFEKDYPCVTNEGNVDAILQAAKERKARQEKDHDGR